MKVKGNILDEQYNVSLSPIDVRFNNYYGDVFISSLKNKLTIEKENYLISLVNTNKFIYPKMDLGLLLFLFNYNNLYKNKRICSDFIAEILDKLDISNGIQKSKKKKVAKNIINLTDGEIYDSPIHIIMDKSIVKDLNGF